MGEHWTYSSWSVQMKLCVCIPGIIFEIMFIYIHMSHLNSKQSITELHNKTNYTHKRGNLKLICRSYGLERQKENKKIQNRERAF